MNLHDYLDSSVRKSPSAVAVEEASGATVSYAGLGELSDRLRDRLLHLGVQPGDRVGMYVRKSIDGVATVFGALKSGAAYVPVDPTAPAVRNGYILGNSGAKAVVVEKRFVENLTKELTAVGHLPPLLVIDEVGGGEGLARMLDAEDAKAPAPKGQTRRVPIESLAYILYTSGSTGKPKGVMLSHENATSFVEWCNEVFAPVASDKFSSHAPFHFDLSILDIYTPIRTGATLVLVPEDLGKEQLGLAKYIADKQISVWYSAPSILAMMAQFGKLGTHDYSKLRIVLFAGEVFPVVHLRSLALQWPHPRYFNLYGPTETNVCTWYEVVPPIDPARTDPFPIGKVCENLEGIVVDTDDSIVSKGSEGELLITGPNVLQGYFNLPEQTAKAFFEHQGKRYYRTGDIVIEEPDGDLKFVGRRDRMVKKRGYRVELGEIETCLYRNEQVKEAAVIALPDEAAGVLIIAHLASKSGDKISLIALKKFCADHLPLYMVPDKFTFHPALPKTSTDKIDYQTLKSLG
jgi:amino acid adenylation domain-containing protein